MAKKSLKSSGNSEQGIDLFEDYGKTPKKVNAVLEKYSDDFEDGNYAGMEKALKEVEKLGYTFEYGLDGTAYDLRPIGTKGKSEMADKMATGGSIPGKKEFCYEIGGL